MYINRALLLSLIALIVFFPSIEEWLITDNTAWHRPYLIWLLVIAGVWINQRSSHPDEL